MNTTLEKLKERIKDKKYKLTTQRQTILQAFILSLIHIFHKSSY